MMNNKYILLLLPVDSIQFRPSKVDSIFLITHFPVLNYTWRKIFHY